MKFEKSIFQGIVTLAKETEKNLATQRAEKARAEAREKLKAHLKPFKYLKVGNTVYQFPKTEVLPARFAQKMAQLGQNPEDYKLLAVKPRNSNPIEVSDLRLAVRRANLALVANVKGCRMEVVENADGEGYTAKGTFTGTRLAWPALTGKTDNEFLKAVRKSDLAIWYE